VRRFVNAEWVPILRNAATEGEVVQGRTVARHLGQLAEQVAEGSQRDRLDGFKPTDADGSGGARTLQGLREEPCLATAGLTGDQGRSRSSVPGRPRHQCEQGVQLGPATDERGTHGS
jgi:hypothetical protein